jgi:hypothetical protein
VIVEDVPGSGHEQLDHRAPNAPASGPLRLRDIPQEAPSRTELER